VHEGSVRAELDGTGALTKSFRYAAYGAIAQSAGGSPTLLGFGGELVDTTGLTYLRARWYDSQVGRFLTRDPIPGAVVAPATLNVYGYVAGNPVNRQDPSGRLCLPCIGGGRRARWLLGLDRRYRSDV
jgi:RHS repeat-associated protein